ncbi:MAG TPA: hypothetical protein PKV72_04600 [Candidatus Peribacteria bacterium]|nr:hypothetical protein [Candidatus Peribacteria bacterium]
MSKRLTLYLTAKERLLLGRQDDAVTSRCEIVEEDHGMEDNAKHRKLRAELFAPKHPVLRGLAGLLAKETCGEEQARAFVAQSDLSSIDTGDMLELMFLLGPVGMTSMIFEMLTAPSAAKNLEMIAELTELRHHLLFAQDTTTSSSSSV